ncbi:MAG: hypothetical protein GY777_04840 [Candidatus Brocadiaceae bacterium]|nr:hypothetical protein [Candidatus Brocadiaceae bacterium]
MEIIEEVEEQKISDKELVYKYTPVPNYLYYYLKGLSLSIESHMILRSIQAIIYNHMRVNKLVGEYSDYVFKIPLKIISKNSIYSPAKVKETLLGELNVKEEEGEPKLMQKEVFPFMEINKDMALIAVSDFLFSQEERYTWDHLS